MSAEEFENYCQGLADDESSSSNNVLKLIQTNLKVLGELKDKQKLLKQETLKLQTDITIFRQLMQNKFNACLNNNKENYTQNVPDYVRNKAAAPSKPSVLDDSLDVASFNASVQNTSLLEPLKPSLNSNEADESKTAATTTTQ